MRRDFTRGEEIANWITHGVGALLSLAALGILMVHSIQRGDAWHVGSFTIFGLSLTALYASSTAYHATTHEKKKSLFCRFDHAAIFFLIAGTYTPFLLISLRGVLGWTLFGIIWGLCGTGALFQLFAKERHHRLLTVVYLLAGWLIVVAIKPLSASLPAGGMQLLVAGGLCYTFGVIFFVWHRLQYHHAVWHAFVLGGSICHFLAVILFLLPDAI